MEEKQSERGKQGLYKNKYLTHTTTTTLNSISFPSNSPRRPNQQNLDFQKNNTTSNLGLNSNINIITSSQHALFIPPLIPSSKPNFFNYLFSTSTNSLTLIRSSLFSLKKPKPKPSYLLSTLHVLIKSTSYFSPFFSPHYFPAIAFFLYYPSHFSFSYHAKPSHLGFFCSYVASVFHRGYRWLVMETKLGYFIG